MENEQVQSKQVKPEIVKKPNVVVIRQRGTFFTATDTDEKLFRISGPYEFVKSQVEGVLQGYINKGKPSNYFVIEDECIKKPD